MGFLTRLELIEPFDTWGGMEGALEERFFDGMSMAIGSDQRRTASIYVLGYVAEMILKVGYFRFLGIPPAQSLANELKTARGHAIMKGRNLHDLEGWRLMVVGIRIRQGSPLPPSFDAELKLRVAVIQGRWRETIRYRYSQAQDVELAETFAAADWLYDNRHQI